MIFYLKFVYYEEQKVELDIFEGFFVSSAWMKYKWASSQYISYKICYRVICFK